MDFADYDGEDAIAGSEADDDGLYGDEGNDTAGVGGDDCVWGGDGDDFCKRGPGTHKLKSCESGHK